MGASFRSSSPTPTPRAASSSIRIRPAIVFVIAMLTRAHRDAWSGSSPPAQERAPLVPLITAIGASLFLQNTVGFFGPQTRAYPVPDVLSGDKI